MKIFTGKFNVASGIIVALALVLSGTSWAGGSKGLNNMPTITMKLHAEEGAGKDCPHKEKKEGCRCQGMETVTVDMNDVIAFHGHLCPGSSLGYRACQAAFSHLYPGELPPRGDQFVVSGATKACPNDAVSFVTGARYGKASEGILNGNMAFDKSLAEKDMAFIFASMSTGKAIKLVSKFEWPKEFGELKAKAATDAEAKEKLEHMTRCLSKRVLTAPEKEVFEVTPLTDFSWKEYKDKYLK